MFTVYAFRECEGQYKSRNSYPCPKTVEYGVFAKKEDAAARLEDMRRGYRNSGEARITTGGQDYFTIKYSWPIKGAELRHTFYIEPIPVF